MKILIFIILILILTNVVSASSSGRITVSVFVKEKNLDHNPDLILQSAASEKNITMSITPKTHIKFLDDIDILKKFILINLIPSYK